MFPFCRLLREKGNLVVSDETVIYDYESSTLTTDRLHYKLQTRPLVREGAPSRRAKQLSCKRKIWSWVPKWSPPPRLTAGHNINSTQREDHDQGLEDLSESSGVSTMEFQQLLYLRHGGSSGKLWKGNARREKLLPEDWCAIVNCRLCGSVKC
jgi:hypothetical protein